MNLDIDNDDKLFDAPQAKSNLPKDASVILSAVLRHRGWDERKGQVEMTEGISNSIRTGYPGEEIDVSVNAPVGTGKSLGYIIGAIAEGKRIIVATSTKSLQEQLINEELPKLKKDLKEIYDFDLTFAMMKGKANYPCISSVRTMLREGDNEDLTLFDDIEEPDTRDVDILKQILERASTAQESREPVLFDAEALMGNLQRSTRSNISGSKSCAVQRERWVDTNKIGIDTSEELDPREFPQEVIDEFRAAPDKVACASKCIYRAAYAHAMTAQVVVVNTTLLAYELIKTDAINSAASLSPYLLKGVGTIVVDEAHHLYKALAQAFSVEFDVHKSMKLVEDIYTKLAKRYGESSLFSSFRNDLLDFERALNHSIDSEGGTENELRKELTENLFGIAERCQAFSEALTLHAIRAERDAPSGLAVDRNGLPKLVSGMTTQINEDITSAAIKLADQMVQVDSAGIHQFSLNFSDAGNPLAIKSVPIDVSFFRRMVSRTSSMYNLYTGDMGLELPAAIILSSGTITQNTPTAVGMKRKRYFDVESPFDGGRVRVFVSNIGVSKGISDTGWTPKAWQEIEKSIIIAGGRTMILTTSHRKCEEFTNIARQKLPSHFNVISQGDNLGKAELIRNFKDGENMVLVGTTSFWEGVDIPGDDLLLLVIEKIPFPQPNDPIFQAREKYIEARGGNAFMESQVDYASSMLAQGFGRVQRAIPDVGGIIFLDDRMVTKRYAPQLTTLLPDGYLYTSKRPEFEDWMEVITPESRADEFAIPSTNGQSWLNIADTIRNAKSKGLPRRRISG